MRCPVCDTTLVMSNRNGVEIDYCPACRGVWLDRGELDKVIERASGHSEYSREHSRREDHDDRCDIDAGDGGNKTAQRGVDGGGDPFNQPHKIGGLRIADIDNLKRDQPAQNDLNDDNPEGDIQKEKQDGSDGMAHIGAPKGW